MIMAQDHKYSLGKVAMVRNTIHSYFPTSDANYCHEVPWQLLTPQSTSLHSGSLWITGRHGQIRTEPEILGTANASKRSLGGIPTAAGHFDQFFLHWFSAAEPSRSLWGIPFSNKKKQEDSPHFGMAEHHFVGGHPPCDGLVSHLIAVRNHQQERDIDDSPFPIPLMDNVLKKIRTQ